MVAPQAALPTKGFHQQIQEFVCEVQLGHQLHLQVDFSEHSQRIFEMIVIHV